MEEKQVQPQTQIHIVMFPMLAYGHILPFIEFAKSLAIRGLKISIVSTPLNILWIKQQLSQSQAVAGIHLVDLELPSVEGLPPGVESTAHLINGGTLHLLVEALDRCKDPFEALLKNLSPHFIIYDLFHYWIPQVASNLGIPAILFNIMSTASVGYGAQRETDADLETQLPDYPSSKICLRSFELAKILSLLQKNKEGISFVDRLRICVNQSWAIASNTCIELEGAFIEYWKMSTGRPVFPVGILMPQLNPKPVDDPSLEWLNSQAPRSVVVVSFGTQSILTSEEVFSIALGLEETFMPFIFVLRDNDMDALPQGFNDRIHGRGLIVTGWMPQLHILSHPSTGAFLTHCGWNSALEGLRFGLPLIALPMQYEQGLTARLLVDELNFGVEVRRNEEDGYFAKEDISKAVRSIMVEEQGTSIKANVARLSELLTSNDFQIHRSNVENFISMLKKEAMQKNLS